MDEKSFNQFIWFMGTAIIVLVWTIVLLMFFETPIAFIIAIAGPFASFFIVDKTTNLFRLEWEIEERMRQGILKKIARDLKNAIKVFEKLGYDKKLCDAMYKPSSWEDPTRGSPIKIATLLRNFVQQVRREIPPKEMHAEEIRYIVEQKMKTESKIPKQILEAERIKRLEEIRLLDELMVDEDEEDEQTDEGTVEERETEIIEKVEDEVGEQEEAEEEAPIIEAVTIQEPVLKTVEPDLNIDVNDEHTWIAEDETVKEPETLKEIIARAYQEISKEPDADESEHISEENT
jgi:hypothetical protein